MSRVDNIKKISFEVRHVFPNLVKSFDNNLFLADRYSYYTWYLRLAGIVDYNTATDDIDLIRRLRSYIDTNDSREELEAFRIKLAKHEARFWYECIYFNDDCTHLIIEGSFKEVINVKNKY